MGAPGSGDIGLDDVTVVCGVELPRDGWSRMTAPESEQGRCTASFVTVDEGAVREMKRLYSCASDGKVGKYYGLERDDKRQKMEGITVIHRAGDIAPNACDDDEVRAGDAGALEAVGGGDTCDNHGGGSDGLNCFDAIHDELVILILQRVNNIYNAAGLTSTCTRLNNLLMRGGGHTNDGDDFLDRGDGRVADVVWRDAVMRDLAYLGRAHLSMLFRRCYGTIM